MQVLAFLVFAAAAAAVAFTIRSTLAGRGRRVVSLMLGNVEVVPPETPRERWARVHLDGDRARPFHVIRASPRRGLLGRRDR